MARYKGSDHTSLFWVLIAGVVIVLLGFYISRDDTVLSPDMPPADQAPMMGPEPVPAPRSLDPAMPEAPIMPDTSPDQALPEQTNPNIPEIPVPPDPDPI